MQIRRNAYELGGGDLVQLKKTRKYLLKLGIQVDISTQLKSDLANYDLVHLFNLLVVGDSYQQCLNAYHQNKPIVLSSIYWNKDEYLLNNSNWKVRLALFVGGKKLAVLLIKNRRFYDIDYYKQKQILKKVNIILSTSRKEVSLIEQDFRVNLNNLGLSCLKHFVLACSGTHRRTLVRLIPFLTRFSNCIQTRKPCNYKIVPLGIEKKIFAKAEAMDFIKNTGLENFVLCVGRFEDLKNQLSLIKVFGGTHIKIVFIGSKNPKFLDYYNTCQKEARKYSNVYLLPPMPQNQLASAYAAARVHVSLSWFETFSLVSFEAAAAGCQIVATSRSPIREYFGDLAFYCHPGDLNSIKQAVLEAYNKPPDQKLRNIVISQFNWFKVAQELATIYEEILSPFKK